MGTTKEDRKYLRKRDGRWAVRVKVPADVQSILGKHHLEQALYTDSLSVAQRERWDHVAKFKALIERARSGGGITREEIEDAARYERAAALAEFQRDGVSNTDGLDAASAAMSDLLDRRAHLSFTDVAREHVKRMHLSVDETSKEFDDLCRALIMAHMEALETRIAILGGRPRPAPERYLDPELDPMTGEIVVHTPTKNQRGKSISEVGALFVAEVRSGDHQVTRSTIASYETAIRLLSGFMDDAPLSSFDLQMAGAFIDDIQRLHPNWGQSPKTKQRSYSEIIERFADKDKKLSATTLNKYTTDLGALWVWARKRGHVVGENPWPDQRRKTKKVRQTRYEAWTVDELNTLFQAPLFTCTAEERLYPDWERQKSKYDHVVRWMPILGLFSGMRLNEITQLRIEDIKEVEGSLCFSVDENDGNSVKNEQSIRLVPIHSEIIRCGFLEYLDHASKHEAQRLFPLVKAHGIDGRASDKPSNRFTKLRREVGVERPRVVFHSLRKNMIQAMQAAGVAEEMRTWVVGHEHTSVHNRSYADRPPVSRLVPCVEAVSYAGLDISHLYTS